MADSGVYVMSGPRFTAFQPVGFMPGGPELRHLEPARETRRQPVSSGTKLPTPDTPTTLRVDDWRQLQRYEFTPECTNITIFKQQGPPPSKLTAEEGPSEAHNPTSLPQPTEPSEVERQNLH